MFFNVCVHSRSFPLRADWRKSNSAVDGEPQENWRWNSSSFSRPGELACRLKETSIPLTIGIWNLAIRNLSPGIWNPQHGIIQNPRLFWITSHRANSWFICLFWIYLYNPDNCPRTVSGVVLWAFDCNSAPYIVCFDSERALVVQRFDSTIHRINHCPAS